MPTYLCPAKLNLVLDVGPARGDGFHPVVTALTAISLHDRLEVSPRPGPLALELTAAGAELPELGRVEDNLVMRAARSLLGELGRPAEGFGFRLEKRIPAQAGLGGGSSDAAAALVALRDLLDAEIPGERLLALAAGLGSDVPFFLSGGTQLGTGRGELLRPLPGGPRLAGLLLKPLRGISTPAAYRALDGLEPRKGWDPERGWGAALPIEAEAWLGALRNDFDRVAEQLCPGVRECREALTAAGAPVVLLAGSGSAVAGLWSQAEGRHQALHRLRTPAGATGPIPFETDDAGVRPEEDPGA